MTRCTGILPSGRCPRHSFHVRLNHEVPYGGLEPPILGMRIRCSSDWIYRGAPRGPPVAGSSGGLIPGSIAAKVLVEQDRDPMKGMISR